MSLRLARLAARRAASHLFGCLRRHFLSAFARIASLWSATERAAKAVRKIALLTVAVGSSEG
jgi:hypothetical protein